MLESARQRNCLYMMYKDILNGITAIMFVRRQDSLGKSLITVAIEGGRIAQARGFCNRDLTEEEAAFWRRLPGIGDLSVICIFDGCRR